MEQISLEELLALREDRDFLTSLRSAGVDNWDGFDYAMEIFREDFPQYFGGEDD